MLEQVETRLARSDDFALKSTLASRSIAPFIERCKNKGYRFTLIYVWLRNADLAVERVAQSVKSGGHDVPDDVIRRHYERGANNFLELYWPMANRVVIWNNSSLNTKPHRNFLMKPWIDDEQFGEEKVATRSPQMDIIAEAFREAVADAVEIHQRMGRSVVVSENGVVTRIRPGEITPRALPHDARGAQLDAQAK